MPYASLRWKLPWFDLVTAEDIRIDSVAEVDWKIQESRLGLQICESRDIVRMLVKSSKPSNVSAEPACEVLLCWSCRSPPDKESSADLDASVTYLRISDQVGKL